MTNQSPPQPSQQDGDDKFISSSNLVNTGKDVDHNKVIFCEAVNNKGREKVKSTEKSLYIQCKYILTYSCTVFCLLSPIEMVSQLNKINP